MPGLSQYTPDQYPSTYPTDLEEDFLSERSDLEAKVTQRYIDSLGFANPGRAGVDEIFHGLVNSVPKEYLDKHVQDLELNEIHPMTYRQLIEMIKSMSPSNTYESP